MTGKHMRRSADCDGISAGEGLAGGERGGARRLLSAALFLVGLGVFLAPSVLQFMGQREADAVIERALGGDEGDSAAAMQGSSATATSGKRAKEGDAAYEYLAAYNERVRAGDAGAVNDPWELADADSELASLGLDDGIIGSISIPAMDVRLPLYLGATYEHMAAGAAVISGTSAPLGGRGANVAIAGHRGVWRGVPIFRDIENVEVGDTMTVETPWDTLVYRAVETRVVSPDDVDAVAAQKGRDLVTLVTCHPYGHNYQRYLVYFERVEDAGGAGDATAGGGLVGLSALNPVAQVMEPTESEDLALERWLRLAASAVLVGVALTWAVRAILRAATRRGGR